MSEGKAFLTQAIVKSQSPEEREYARYLDEIEVRKRRVAELQFQLEQLNETLGWFNAEYHARVGVLFVELDKLDLAIDEYEFRIARLTTTSSVEPSRLEEDTRAQFASKRAEIHHDDEETRRYQQTSGEDRQLPQLDAATEATLRSVYRELVRRFHPDLARTDIDRQQRESVMKRINGAFHERDLDTLQSLLSETAIEDASFESRPISEKLIWAIRELSRLDALVTTMTADIQALNTSDLALLWQRHQTGERVLERLETDLNRRLESRSQALQRLIAEFLALAAGGQHD